MNIRHSLRSSLGSGLRINLLSHLRIRGMFASLLILCFIFANVPVAAAAQIAPPVQQDDEGAVTDLQGVEDAVIQIESVGTFVDPSEGLQQNTPGYGSGFIISPDGIAVTNNHVVTGGALYRVFISGRDEPVNARVLGASECADLAVIDLQGSGYPFLSWYDGDVRAGLDVYAAGFPLGDPEFALTRGIVSKPAADGESNWASLDSVIMHDATINPGNSGGPLVTEDGQVVGVNYAGNDETNQYFAIPGVYAQEIIAELGGGNDLYSLGINGEAFDDGDGFYGIWVYSVKSGSPADIAGIRPGDIIMEIESIPVGEDGILADYCDILASHDSTDTMAVKVYRPDTDEVLDGQFNGRPLAASINPTDDSGSDTPGEQSTTTDDQTYVPLQDDAGIMYVEVPDTWSDTDQSDWEIDDEVVGTRLRAVPDLEAFVDDWSIPGIIFSYSDSVQDTYDPLDLLDTIDYADSCTYVGRTELDDDAYFSGAFDEYEECGDTDTSAFIAVLLPEDEDYLIGLEIYANSDEDLAAQDHIIDTFDVLIGSSNPSANVGSDIFDIVDVSGLEWDFVFYDGPYASLIVPEEWDEIVEEDWVSSDDEVLGKVTRIAADVEEHQSSWNEPGVMVYLMTDIIPDFSTEVALDDATFDEDCEFVERIPHEWSIYGLHYSGAYDVFTDCNGADTTFYTGAFVDDDVSHAFYLDFVTADDAGDEAFDVALNSLYYSAAVQPLANPDEFTTVVDDSGSISVLAPVEWVDVESGPFIADDEEVGVEMTVATDVEDYNDSWEVSGMYLGLWEDFGSTETSEVLDTLNWEEDCIFDARYDIDSERFTGQYDLWNDCGDVEGSTMATFALIPVDNEDDLLIVYLYMATPDDLRILDPMLNSLTLVQSEDPTIEAVEEEPVEEVTEETTESGQILVDIVTPTLNVRTGPGTNYERIATVSQGYVMGAVGQFNNCAWLLIEDVDGEQGWVSGDPAYTTINGTCADIPETDAPVAPPPSSNTGNSGSSTSGSTSTATGQGCVNWKNQVGIEVNITLTRKSDNWNTSFQIPKGGTQNHCVDAGEYTYTASAPNGGSINGDLSYTPGMNMNFDLNP